ncbi:hypothetical protein AB0M39_25270 [Streptomyces sp. NPDC051907]|uniref:hypothetical protein n=1 Tax=Streptomyces sp. NPDC051907 TaxID=3155284 RepID=UPI00343262D4
MVANDVVRHPRLNSDAKILIVLIQGLPDSACDKPLSEHASDLGMKPRAYQRAKEQLVACGFLHEWKWQGTRGRWVTEQLVSNVALTREGANAVREGVPQPTSDPGDPPAPPTPPAAEPPSVGGPTVGEPESPEPGGSPPEVKTREKNNPHPPPSTPDETDGRDGSDGPGESDRPEVGETEVAEPEVAQPEVVEAERLLLSLRHTRRDLLLGVREARALADAAAEWLRRGLSTADLRQALTAGLPPGGVRSAVGFVRHRLIEKLPAPIAPSTPAASAAGAAPTTSATSATAAPGAVPAGGLITCKGPGDEHVFRAVADETHCAPCRRRTAAAAQTAPRPRSIPWRTRVQEAAAGA